MDALDYNEQTVTIILRSHQNKNSQAVGIIVDAVSEVYKFSSESIRKAPDFGSNIDSCFIKGLTSVDDKLVILLDTIALLAQEELYQINDNTSLTGRLDREQLCPETEV